MSVNSSGVCNLTSKSHVPPEWPSVIPRLSVDNPEEAVSFLRYVFAAQGDFNQDRPSEMRIDDSLIMVAGNLERTPSVSFLYVYVPDTDASYLRALELGAEGMEEPTEMPYGDRRSMVRDKWGNVWQIATHGKFLV